MFIWKDTHRWYKFLLPKQINYPIDGCEGMTETIFFRWLNFGWFKNIELL